MIDPGAAARAISDSLRRGASAPSPAGPVSPLPGAPGDRRHIGSSIAKYPDEPLPDLTDPAVSVFDKGRENTAPAPLETTYPMRTVGDVKDWQIARSVSSKQVNDAISSLGGHNAVVLAWNDENRPATVGLINSIAKAIVTGE